MQFKWTLLNSIINLKRSDLQQLKMDGLPERNEQGGTFGADGTTGLDGLLESPSGKGLNRRVACRQSMDSLDLLKMLVPLAHKISRHLILRPRKSLCTGQAIGCN